MVINSLKRVFSNPLFVSFYFVGCILILVHVLPIIFRSKADLETKERRKQPKHIPMKKKNGWCSFAAETLKQEHFDFFVFGHRHLPLDVQLNEKSRYINTGDWLDYYSYAVFDGEKMELKYYRPQAAHNGQQK
jgi:UDP-2,3-diacylglucosamine pyrophosphatase LpxH